MKKQIEKINIEEIIPMVNKSPFYKTISMTLLEINKDGSLFKIKSDINKHHNYRGIMHGGVIAALVDSSCGASLAPYLKEGEITATISLHIDYIAATIDGDLFGRGRMIHRGRQLARAEAVITNENEKLIAKGYASFMITSSRLKK
ncbi:MAG: hypothetical protein CVU54_01655 [Deltaproteobacteria bacterium HGW-Deltaproteobacteria-12]|jgi:acyl-CoA thioesterase|nr:MAG: hypothetical protein CVU54_01655 [Deltaproteobacteria bacterium HGW-Deltaproteobacteria-12]